MEKYYDSQKCMEYSLKGQTVKITKEGQEIFDLKPLTEEEIAWFIDFAREQYLVRWDDMRETLKIAQRQKELQRQTWGNKV